MHYVVAEQNRELVEQLRAADMPAVAGNAAEPAVLIQAHIARAAHAGDRDAGYLPRARDDRNGARAQSGDPDVVRTHNEEEAELLREETRGQGVPRRARAGAQYVRLHLPQAQARPARTSNNYYVIPAKAGIHAERQQRRHR